MRLKRFVESTGYKTEQISLDYYYSLMEEIPEEDYVHFTRKELMKLVDYFEQYIDIKQMSIQNNDTEVEPPEHLDEDQNEMFGGFFPIFLVKKIIEKGSTLGDIELYITISKGEDDWYYLTAEIHSENGYPLDDGHCRVWKCDQYEGLINQIESVMSEWKVDKSDPTMRRKRREVERKLDDLKSKIGLMDKKTLDEVMKFADNILNSK
jgi:hypothetical protein